MRFLSWLARFQHLLASLAFLLMILFAIEPGLAQSLPATRTPPPQPPPPPPAVDQEQFISYWTTEIGWRAELQLRNNQVGQTLTVTPVLRAADGAETPLPPVLVQPQEVKTLDVATAIGSSAPQLIGSYGSLVLRYRTPSAINLYAVAMIMGVGHSIAFHIDGTGEDQTEEVGSREGIWLLPNESASDYLVLTNQGQNPLQTNLSVSDSGGRTYTQTITLAPRGLARYSIRQIVSAAKLGGSYGGISVSAVSHAGSLDTLHVLFESSGGFSAVMKMFDYDSRVQLKERDYARTGKWILRAPMLALSDPDPALGFPAGTTLHPQVFVRNTTAKPIEAALRFTWRSATITGRAAGPQLHLFPYETRLIDVAALQDGTVLPRDANWTSVIITSNSLPDELIAVAASYDQSLRYGAQTPFSDQLAFHYAGSQWQYDPYHDSIITVGNGGTKPTRAAFTIFYDQGAQKYELEQTLQPDEQMWMDVGKLIREKIPDKNGNTLPTDLTSGSYEIRDLDNHSIGALFEGKVIYDKTYGHVTYGCALCCGYNKPGSFFFDPLGIPFGAPSDQGVNAYDNCSGNWYDVSDSFYGAWSTLNTAIATVNTYGTHTGVSLGSTTSNTYGYLQAQDNRNDCPLEQFRPTGGDSVHLSLTFGDTPLVPMGKPVSTTATVNPSTNTQPITLTISTTSGTGSATFGNGYSTMTITTTTSVILVGVTASSTPNNMQLSASIPSGTLATMTFTVTGPINGAIPVNFRVTGTSLDPDAVLTFQYTWDSSTGNKADLSTCQVEEYVTYVGPNPYPWASPPYLPGYVTSWPSTGDTPVSASVSGLVDHQRHQPGWQKPYIYNFAASNQQFQFQCPYYQNNQWVQLMPITGTIAISRVINYYNSNPNSWYYEVTKSGLSNSINLP